jgi:hypothetical protein
MADSGKKYYNILAGYLTPKILYINEPVGRKTNIDKCLKQSWQEKSRVVERI